MFRLFRTTTIVVLTSLLLVAGLFAAGQGEETGAAADVTVEPGPFGKYEPPVTVSVALSSGVAKYPEGQSVDDNVWTRGYMDEMGIDVGIAWVASSGEEYDQKLNVNIASGDIPDLFQVDAEKLAQLVESDLIADLGSAYEQYASDDMKRRMEMNEITLAAASFDGALKAIPHPRDPGMRILWVRTDWIENLGLDYPETYDEMIDVMDAFVNDDPDGNGEDDTFAFPVRKELWGWPAFLQSFFNANRSYIDIWVEDPQVGELVYGSVQPQVKDGLARLRQMYADGWIDREFAVKGNSGIFEDMAANKFGLMFQASSGPARFRDLKKNQPQSDWKPVLIPAVDGGVASSETNVAPGGFWVVRKGYPFPGVAWKLANFRMEKLAGETAELKYHTIGEIQTSLLGVRMIINHPDNTGHDSTYKKIVVDRLDEGITSEEGLIPQNKLYLESILAVESGDYNVQQWFLTRVFGRGGSGQLMYEAKEAGLDVFEIDQFYGVPGDAMARNWATLTTMRDEVFTKIIMGESELDAFDDFVRDWYRLGGREVTQEVNDWADARQ